MIYGAIATGFASLVVGGLTFLIVAVPVEIALKKWWPSPLDEGFPEDKKGQAYTVGVAVAFVTIGIAVSIFDRRDCLNSF